MTTNAENSLEQDLLFAIIKERYGHVLTGEQLDSVRTAIAGQREALRPIREYKVANDEEPFSQFKPFRGD